MKTIGILGCGWLGLHLSHHLLQMNYSVKGSTTSPSKLDELKAQGIDPYLVDLQNLNEDEINAFLSDIEVLVITIPPIRGVESALYQTSFKRLIPYLTQHQVKNVMMMSSVSVYEPSETLITEATTAYSNDPTSRQLIEAEEVLWSTRELTTYILRLGGLFGPDRKPVRYIVNRGILDNPAMPINMIHLNDIIQFTTALLAEDFKTNEIYNFVSPHYKNRLDYYTREAEALGLTLPPLGANDPKTHRKIEGSKIVLQTGIPYQTL